VGHFVPLRRRVLGLALLLGEFLWQGCAAPLREARVYPALQERHFELHRLAVAPFQAGRLVVRASGRQPVDPSTAALVSKQVAEALRARGIEVVAPEDVRTAADPSAAPTDTLDAARLVSVASQQFGADAVLVGTVLRWRDRVGEKLGASQAAGVGFEVTLLRTPDGAKLWTAVFDETQLPITDNFFNVFRYPGGGTRWLTAEELSQWGATEVAQAMPTSS
jgi:hypothetical protein